jgi:plasmid stabilization system protein ParE
MRRYFIHYTARATQDMDDLYWYIAYEVMAPDTAVKYFNELLDTINNLEIIAASLAQSQNVFLTSTYGIGVRTICYKKMTVVYRVVGSMVVVIRVMAGALIK